MQALTEIFSADEWCNSMFCSNYSLARPTYPLRAWWVS